MQNNQSPKARLRVLQIIHSALMMGIILFYSVVLLIKFTSGPNGQGSTGGPSGFDPMTMVLYVTLFGAIAARAIMPPISLKNALKKFAGRLERS